MIDDTSTVTPRPSETKPKPEDTKGSPQQRTKDPKDEGPKWPGGGRKGENEQKP